MNLQPCWYCGAQPERQTKILIGAEWAAYSCCTTGSYSPHENNAVDSWNRMQAALALLRAVERLSHIGGFRVVPFDGKYNALMFDRQKGFHKAGMGESAADALTDLLDHFDAERVNAAL